METTVSQLYYSELSLTTNNISRIKLKLTHKEIFVYGAHVQKLVIQHDKNSSFHSTSDNKECLTLFTTAQFLLLLSWMPKLIELDLTSSYGTGHYLQILTKDTKDNIYLKYIQRIPYTKDGESIFPTDPKENMDTKRLHFAVCYKYRATLTHLTVFDQTQTINGYSGKPNFYLPHFIHLTNLSIHCECDPNLTIFELLDPCPNMKSLIFSSNFIGENDRKDGFTKCQHLEELIINVPSLTAPYIEYITTHFPK